MIFRYINKPLIFPNNQSYHIGYYSNQHSTSNQQYAPRSNIWGLYILRPTVHGVDFWVCVLWIKSLFAIHGFSFDKSNFNP